MNAPIESIDPARLARVMVEAKNALIRAGAADDDIINELRACAELLERADKEAAT